MVIVSDTVARETHLDDTLGFLRRRFAQVVNAVRLRVPSAGCNISVSLPLRSQASLTTPGRTLEFGFR